MVERYKAGMRRLASGVSVIATSHEGVSYGLVVTSLGSISVDPPTVFVCVNQSASAHNPIRDSRHFSANVLPVEMEDVARTFADAKQRDSRFKLGHWTTLRSPAPILLGALVSYDCRVVTSASYASHTVFVGQVLDIRLGEAGSEPLVYVEREYRLLQQRQQLQQSA